MIEDMISNHFQCETKESILTIGNFDGIHLGHDAILKKVIQIKRDRRSLLLTFTPHPVTFFLKKKHPLIIANLQQKQKMVLNYGIDRVIVQKFYDPLSRLRPHQFLELLKNKLNVTTIVTGKNFHFGKKQQGGAEDIRGSGIELIQLNDTHLLNQMVSSSSIRKLLKQGDVAKANQFLKTKFTLTGDVVKGFQRGRDLGFPTANLNIKEANQIIPQVGVYLSNVLFNHSSYPALTNIGYNPTFGQRKKTIETFILNFNDNLYGQQISIVLHQKIRDEIPFQSTDLLVRQMKEDLNIAKDFFTKLL